MAYLNIQLQNHALSFCRDANCCNTLVKRKEVFEINLNSAFLLHVEYAASQCGENKDKMVSGTSVKITNVSQVNHESKNCLATAGKNSRNLCGNRETAPAATMWKTAATKQRLK